MKGIILDIDKLSDSKELYSQKPRRIFIYFIYAVVIIFAVALVYSFIGRIEVVAQGSGVIRPNEQVSTVSGLVDGQVEEVRFMDGISVQEGDVLLVLDYTAYQTDLKNFEQSKQEVEQQLDMTKKYITSIQQGQNLFSKDADSEEYPWYVKYELFTTAMKEKEIEFEYEQEQSLTSKLWLEKEVGRQNDDLRGLNLLKKSVEEGKNLVSAYPRYSYQYQVYQSTLDGINLDRTKESQVIEQDTSSDTQQLTMDFYTQQVEGYNTLLSSINADKNMFADSNNMFSLMYEEYAYLQQDARQALENTKLQLDMLRENTSGESVSSQQIAMAELEVKSAEQAITTKKNQKLQEVKAALAEAQQKLDESSLQKSSAMDKQQSLDRMNETYQQAVEEKKLSMLQQTEESIQALKIEQTTNAAEMEQLESTLEKYEKSKTGADEAVPVAYMRLQELQTYLDNKESAEQQLMELEYNIMKTQLSIEAATIKASRSGVINTMTDVTRGDVLQAGTMVATIIPPEEQQMKVQIYMDDSNIAGIKPGNKVNFNVRALPSSQYGSLTGTVLSISKDTKNQQSDEQAYYLVEAALDDRTRLDKDGNEGELAVGMTVDAKIVTQEKRIIFFLLEKINIL